MLDNKGTPYNRSLISPACHPFFFAQACAFVYLAYAAIARLCEILQSATLVAVYSFSGFLLARQIMQDGGIQQTDKSGVKKWI